MARFHELEVVAVRHDTRDAIVVTLKPAPESKELFQYIPGQYLTFRRKFDDTEVRRSYSICSGIDEPDLQIAIKRVDGGAFSTWANESLKAGDVLEAMPPLGNFYVAPGPDEARHYLAFAGGSGITPVLSIIKSALLNEPQARFTLVYANQQISSVMFKEELEDLKNRYIERFSVVHVFDREGQEIDLFTGRIDAEKLEALFAHWIHLPSVHTAFICGPEPMMLTIAKALQNHGLAQENIKYELFTSAQPGRIQRRKVSTEEQSSEAQTNAIVVLDGAERSFSLDKHNESLLDAALRHDLDAPYSCKAGVCSTCKAKVLEGEVEMLVNHALEDYEVEQGYVLSCQSYPLTDSVKFSYDE